MITVLIFIAILFALILIHEWGHFIVAKKTGMRVDEFGIGFPPKMFGLKRGETEYSINWLPIGGFVRIFGEDMQTAAEDAPPLSGTERARSFSARPRLAQAAVLLAGVVMNVIFAWFLFALVLMVGVPTAVNEEEAGTAAALLVVDVVANSPAESGGLPLGAEIMAVEAGGEKLTDLTPTGFRAFTTATLDETLTITYSRGGETGELTLKAETGLIADNPDQPAIGVALSLVETVSEPIHVALLSATVRTYDTLLAIIAGLGSLIFDSLRGQADLSQVSGPVGIAGLAGDAAAIGFTSLIIFTAVISLNLAVINLLPFPALDGGRLLFVAIEAIIRRPINPAWAGRLNGLGFILLILLMVVITYNDIAKMF